MKIILLDDVKNYGKKNDIVEVKNGYGHFLIKTNKAVAYTPTSLKILNEHKKQVNIENTKIHEKNLEIINQLKNVNLLFYLSGNKDNYFGSITNKMIIDEMKKKYNIILDKTMFKNSDGYKVGTFTIELVLQNNEQASFKITVKEKKINE